MRWTFPGATCGELHGRPATTQRQTLARLFPACGGDKCGGATPRSNTATLTGQSEHDHFFDRCGHVPLRQSAERGRIPTKRLSRPRNVNSTTFGKKRFVHGRWESGCAATVSFECGDSPPVGNKKCFVRGNGAMARRTHLMRDSVSGADPAPFFVE